MPRPPMQYVRNVQSVDCLDFSRETKYNDWRDDLVRDGYAVVPAISADKAAHYVERMHDWLESFDLGYDRNDPSTIREECLPIISPKGMIQHYGVCHEDTVWQVRQEPGVMGAFETVYGTEDLIVSFDAVNISFANRKDLSGVGAPWPHQDQDPDRPGFRCLQGLVNLLPNGPDDGGLIIAKGAHLLSERYHKELGHEERPWAWTNEMYNVTDEGMKWLEDHNCEWVKVEANPGDLIIWDSRAPHYNVPPTGSQNRMCVYTCYAPVSTATQEELLKKKEIFEKRQGTTHWPQSLQLLGLPCLRNGEPDPLNRPNPINEPQFTEKGWKLTGIPYISSGITA
ncbi:hypothetical protein QFC21_007007 [Naganishia friedmannii]|uniref:Uncharacterized protein n=1 Tax=Naganishia friedmannii TaxID=89922 RepID=A0ACC2V091_9TREE|nr:hypothetical protein QFC21_007007 [Naganishia friedmannii]